MLCYICDIPNLSGCNQHVTDCEIIFWTIRAAIIRKARGAHFSEEVAKDNCLTKSRYITSMSM